MEELYYLYEYIDVFLIIFARILATIMFLPIIEENSSIISLFLYFSIQIFHYLLFHTSLRVRIYRRRIPDQSRSALRYLQ